VDGGTPTISYYHSDHLGSSSVITDQSGQQVAHYEYSPYGAITVNELANGQTGQPANYYFTGKELDATGLYFYGARYYDPEIGRFITADTIVQAPYDPQSLNRYAYCRNNPLNYVDPSGHWFWGVVIFICAMAAAGAVVNVAIAGAAGQITSWTAFWAAMGAGAAFGATTAIGLLSPAAGFFTSSIWGAAVLGVFAGAAAGAAGSAAAGNFSWGAVGMSAAISGVTCGFGRSSVGQALGKAIGKGVGKLPFGQHIQNAGRAVSDKMSQLYQAAKGTGPSATSSLNTNKGDSASQGQVQSGRNVQVYSVDENGNIIPDEATGYRYVGSREAAKIAETGYVPNVSKSGVAKNVFYTTETPLNSASQAQAAYNLDALPTHRIGLNTAKTTNIYGGNVDGGSGIELVTQEEIPAVDIQKLGK
jgi:RHS repeat-associated protein